MIIIIAIDDHELIMVMMMIIILILIIHDGHHNDHEGPSQVGVWDWRHPPFVIGSTRCIVRDENILIITIIIGQGIECRFWLWLWLSSWALIIITILTDRFLKEFVKFKKFHRLQRDIYFFIIVIFMSIMRWSGLLNHKGDKKVFDFCWIVRTFRPRCAFWNPTHVN